MMSLLLADPLVVLVQYEYIPIQARHLLKIGTVRYSIVGTVYEYSITLLFLCTFPIYPM